MRLGLENQTTKMASMQAFLHFFARTYFKKDYENLRPQAVHELFRDYIEPFMDAYGVEPNSKLLAFLDKINDAVVGVGCVGSCSELNDGDECMEDDSEESVSCTLGSQDTYSSDCSSEDEENSTS